MINYAVIGSGWRAEFYLRIAKLVPEVFCVTAMCVRNDEKAKYFENKYGVKTFRTVEETLKEKSDFAVVCINKQDIAQMALEVADRGTFVLCETPIMLPKNEGKHNYDKIQVAEQFHLKGTFAAIKKIIDEGIIGNISSIDVSCCHDYHAVSLVRFFLGDGVEPEKMCQYTFDDKVLKTHGRNGELVEKEITTGTRIIRMYKFGNVSVLYNHSKEQYFSPIRKNRFIIRGTRGEIEDNTVRYFNENNQFVQSEIKHEMCGNLDGFFNNKITFENRVLYEYPYNSSRLSEEETAIAACLTGMKEYIESGKEMYSFDRAYKDYELCCFE